MSGQDLITVRQYLVGMDFQDASKFAEDNGCKLRIMRYNGKDCVGICNLDVLRINVAVEDGVIVGVIGSG